MQWPWPDDHGAVPAAGDPLCRAQEELAAAGGPVPPAIDTVPTAEFQMAYTVSDWPSSSSTCKVDGPVTPKAFSFLSLAMVVSVRAAIMAGLSE